MRRKTTITRPVVPDAEGHHAPRLRGVPAALLSVVAVGVLAAPPAVAAPIDNLRAALLAARSAACGPLQLNPLVEKTALDINETTDRWLDNASRSAPETDAFAVLKDFGYDGTKAKILSGAGLTDVNAIKALLLQGYLDIPNCSFTEYGVSALYNERKSMHLTTVILAV